MAYILAFYETPTRLIRKADHVGLNFSQAIINGLITIHWTPPLEQALDILAAELLALVETQQIRRLVIDGMNTFQQATHFPQRLARFYTALMGEIRRRGVTTLWIVETPDLFGASIEWPVVGAASIAENIIFLRYVDVQAELVRLLSILKVRDSHHDTAIRTFQISEAGIQLGARFTMPGAVLQSLFPPATHHISLSPDTSTHDDKSTPEYQWPRSW